jgi:hypothetical protein
LLREEEENMMMSKRVQSNVEENSYLNELLSRDNIPFTVIVNDGKEVDKEVGNAGRMKKKNTTKEVAGKEQESGEDGGKAATGPGATGTLSGASVSTRQGP